MSGQEPQAGSRGQALWSGQLLWPSFWDLEVTEARSQRLS